MRTRDRDQEWIEELGRRRLEALIAELTPPAGPSGDTGAPPDASAPPTVEAEGVPDDLPAAGRHARRGLSLGGRLGGWAADRLPRALLETGSSRPRSRQALQQGLQQGHVGVLALVLAVAVLLGGWAWMRSTGTATGATEPPAVSMPAPPSGSPGLLTSPPSSSSSETAGDTDAAAPAEVVVHVAGRVRRPGIVVLPAGSRVVDAVRRAGGFVPGVGPRSAALNLARVLVDGEQIVVGAAGVPGGVAAAPAGTSGDATTAAGPLVSLNTADQTALETLPGVGPVTATAILQWRSEHGPFTAVEQLLEVSGIGEATLAEIEPHATL